MTNLTVCCVLVHGHVDFTNDYVLRLKSMVKRHLRRPHRFVCLTDRKIDGVECIRVTTPRYKGWWRKIELFNRKHGFCGRMLYLDLDTLVVDALDPIVDFPANFALVPDDAPNFHGMEGKIVVKGCNSSVMVWDAGVVDYIYDAWDEKITNELWGDQDWIATCCDDYAKMPLEWFPRVSQIKELPDEAKVVLMKKPKNHLAIDKIPWVKEFWC